MTLDPIGPELQQVSRRAWDQPVGRSGLVAVWPPRLVAKSLGTDVGAVRYARELLE